MPYTSGKQYWPENKEAVSAPQVSTQGVAVLQFNGSLVKLLVKSLTKKGTLKFLCRIVLVLVGLSSHPQMLSKLGPPYTCNLT